MESYTPPAITDLGSLHDLTLTSPFNKVGTSTDFASQVVPGLVGDVTPAVS